MPAKSYPFIDIAVHPEVRAHFARGDAAILFAPDLSRVLWSNGEGAALFGFRSIYDFLDAGPSPAHVAFRQMQATARQLGAPGDVRRFLMRVSAGFQSVSLHAALTLIDIRAGETALLFAAPRLGKALVPAEAAARMISGFDDPDTHMAVLDGTGAVLAASPHFAGLGMTDQTRLSLVAAVAQDSDWLLKRPVPTGRGHLPAAIGKLSDDPALHLLFAVETILGHLDAGPDFDAPAPVPPVPATMPVPAEAGSAMMAAEGAASDAAPAENALPTGTFIDEAEGISADEETAPALPDGTATEPDGVVEAQADEVLADAETLTAEPGQDVSTERDVLLTDLRDMPDPLPEPATAHAPAGTDDAIAAAPDMTEDAETFPEPDALRADGFLFDPSMRAVRFVWKIGADGCFSEISSEFATAVGPGSADVIGQSFADLAARFDLDPDETILNLLNRRDTWSGKTVLWPVDGVALRVPVDLAALPTYSRNRDFDGFRGFGIVRVSDAVEDHAARDGAADDGTTEPAPDEATARTDAEPAVPPRATFDDEGDFFVSADAAEPPVETEPGDDGPDIDPFRGERPALKLVETPGRRSSDKVVQLEEHRPTTIETLTRSEQAAFREIARQLNTTFGKRDQPPAPVEAEAGAGDPAAESAIAPDADDVGIASTPAGDAPATTLQEDVEATSDAAEAETVAQDDGDTVQTDSGTAPTEAEDDAPDAEAADTATVAAIDETEEPTPTPDAHDAVATDSPDDAAQAASAAEAADMRPEPETVPVPEAADAAESPASEPDALPVDADEDGLEPFLGSDLSLLTPAMVDRLPVAMLIHSGDDLYHANAAFLALTGYHTVQDLRVEGGIDALFVGEDEGIVDMPQGAMMMIRNDGRLIPVTARLQSVRFEDRGAALMMSLAPVVSPASAPGPSPIEAMAEPDIVAPAVDPSVLAEAQALAATLRVETEELRSILETATDGVVVIGADGDIRSLNRSASALFNYDDGDVHGKPFAMLFAHESQRAVMDYLAGLAGHGVASVLNDGREVIGREASGGFIPLFMTMGRLSSSNGYCAVIRDITQWKRTEEELRNAKRAAETANAHKTDFLARVSHEIRTPLNAIIGFSDMMASEHFGPIGNARYVEYASDIGRSGRHVLDIVNDLLDISKIEAGEMEMEFSAVEINEAVSEAVSLVQPQANAQRVIIRTSLSTSVPNVVADSRSIKQIALNILANAIRFTPSGGQIVVSTAYEPNGSVILRIRDTGIGMTRSELEQAMKPFRQVTTGIRKRGEGTGLGLPLTKAMAEANRALFSINSAPNEGTLVEIAFPSQRVLAN